MARSRKRRPTHKSPPSPDALDSHASPASGSSPPNAPLSALARSWLWVGILAVGAVFAFNIYRAATQSITHDEAVTYDWYLRRAFLKNLGPEGYDANNHLLHTCLAWVSVRVFAASHFTLRLPALAGGLLYLIAAFALCGRMAGRTALGLAMFAALALNPLLMDFFVAARGYSLLLGFFTLALLTADRTMALPVSPKWPRGVWWLHVAGGSLAVSLAVAANLTGAFFAIGFALIWCATILARAARRGGKGGAWRHAVALAAAFGLPAATVASVVLYGPLKAGMKGKYYYGLETLAATARDLLMHSAGMSPEAPVAPWQDALLVGATALLAAILAVLALAAGVAAWHIFLGRDLSAPARGVLIHGGVLIVGLLLFAIGAQAAGMEYPRDRTGLALIVLLTLALGDGLAWLGMRYRRARTAAMVFFACIAFWYATQLRTAYFTIWRYDAGVCRMMREVRAFHDNSQKRVRIGNSWQFQPGINFYRMVWDLKRLEPATRKEYFLKDQFFLTQPFDFFMFDTEQAHLVEDLRLDALVRDPVSGAVLAVRGGFGIEVQPQ